MIKRKQTFSLDDKDKKVLIFISLFIFFLFCLLIIQFYKLQIIENTKWKNKAKLQHQKVEVEPFMRGKIFSTGSKNDVPIVQDVLKFHVYIDPVMIKEDIKNKMFQNLQSFFNLNNFEKDKLEENFYKKSRSRKLFSYIDKNLKENIVSWWNKFSKENKLVSNSLYFIPDYKRSYPFDSLLGQVLHTVQLEKDQVTYQSIPTGGLELYFNNYLQGKRGLRQILRSPRNSLAISKIISSPENGNDIYLTINHYLQAICEEELKKGIHNVNAKGGWAVIMNPHNGEILSLAQYPFFDLKNFQNYFNNSELQEHTRIKSITDAFEPASIFKPLILAICLKANEELMKVDRKPLFYPEEKINTQRGNFPGRGKKPLKDGRLHYYLNMYQGIQKSSNIYMGKVVERLLNEVGESWFRYSLSKYFGLGKKTEIEVPGENPGILPQVGKVHQNGLLEWSKSTPYSIAIGHNILVNSIQMIRAFSIIANGGFDVKPTILKKIVKNNEIVYENSFEKSETRIFSKNITDEVTKAMKYVTKLGGSSRWGDIWGYSEAGKSGTSEKVIDGKYSKKKYLSSFVGFAPATNPKFVLLVAIDEPEVKFVPNVGKMHQGGVCAAMVFKEIASRCLHFLGVEPDDPHGYPYGDPRRDILKADWFKEVKELKKIYDQNNLKK